MDKIKALLLFAVLALFTSPQVSKASSDLKLDNIAELSLEELSELKVYSASKRSEDSDKSPSSVYVITQKDLKQMGVTHIADALRTVPGLQVAKLSSSKWMVSARGFGEQFSNKLLVLIDNRPVYSTLYSGVYWDQQDVALDNIKQIEVIRGPGATLWGANAVNGVINIITKNAEETQGNYLSSTYGTDYRGIEARSGFKLNDQEHMRASLKLNNREDTKTLKNTSNNDEWNSGRVDFRYDNRINSYKSLNLNGELYRGIENIDYNLPSLADGFVKRINTDETYEGLTLDGKWQESLDESSDLLLSSYLNYDKRNFALTTFEILTFSINAQNDVQLSEGNSLIWGGGYTLVEDKIDNSIYLTYTPDERSSNVFNIFAEDTITLSSSNDVYLTLGSKLEHNGYTGFELQPSTKLSWQLDKSDLLWASVSRAVRTPSRGTHNLSLQAVGTPRGYISQIGNSNFESEEVIAYEAGYKTTLSNSLQLDTTVFYNQYENLRAFSPSQAFNNIAIPLNINNNGEATSSGFEISTNYNFSDNLEFWLSYSYINMGFSLNQPIADNTFLNSAERTPQQQFNVRSQYLVTPDLTLNNSFYYVDQAQALGVDDYLKWDANISYEFSQQINFVFAAENLLDPHHQEFSRPLYSNAAEVPRAVFAKIEILF